ncbi:hypothetical protein QBC44DRAFT_275673 [Cladorrhinum sp. PSN332]|nr:hypothetical protein QBC44DRAFT_275673 [Cladorrhinum sp. PSN332]
MAFEVTVGYAAGFIALGLFLVQLWCPTIVTFILAAVLRDKETAATWSVAARSMLSSHWPFMLRSETSSRSHVRTAVYLASISYPAITIITAAAGVVTPLGLYDAVSPSRSLETPKFAYAPDPSSFGVGTGPRLNHTFTRICGSSLPIPCPGENDTAIIVSQGMTGNGSYPFGLRTRVSDHIIDIFSSGTKGARTTISNFFDIEWRQLNWYLDTIGRDDPVYDNGTVRSVGRFQQIDASILRNDYKVVEGLIVDAKDGGVGFRNHTIPSGLSLGAEWTEDILFMEPQTECVNTNLTIEFTLTTENPRRVNETVGEKAGFRNLVIVDRGGFSELNQTYPEFNFDRDNSQTDPELRDRAYKAAWLNNVYTALVFNVTNSNNNKNHSRSWAYMTSSMDKKFPLSSWYTFDSLNRLSISRTMGYYFDTSDLTDSKIFPNPERITERNFSSISILCEGAGNADHANYTNIYTGCFQIRGVPIRIDDGYEGTLEAGGRWYAPIHTCATALKVSIKTVRFNTTGHSNDLSSLRVTQITPKEYSSPDKYPIWGIESTEHWLRDVIPIWGIISRAYENLPGIKALRQPSIYVPGFVDEFVGSQFSSTNMYFNLPAAQFPFKALQAVNTRASATSLPAPVADYSGASSMSMLQRWREIGKNAETAGQIINLIWTDISASAVAGSKGVLGHRNMAPEEEQVKVQVRPVTRKVRYNLAFAVPAIILAFIALLVTVMAGVLACFWGGRIANVHRALRQSSTGRLVTALLGPSGESDLKMGGKEWSIRNGGKELDLSALVPLMVASKDNSGWGEEGDNYNAYKEPSVVTTVSVPQQQQQQQQQLDEGTGYVYSGHNQGYQGYAAVSPVATTTASTTPDPPTSQAQGLQWVMYQGEPYLYYPQQSQAR